MNIHIITIDHSIQRYETVGDWQFIGDDLVIRISKLGDWKKEASLAIHELYEALLCKARGITEEQVDAFDLQYESERTEGDTSEAGDSNECPYHKEHFAATTVERLFMADMGISWTEYESQINEL